MAQRTLILERRKKILDFITKNQKADIKELAELLNETEITIRRDLIELEKGKTIIRVHGGAILNEQKKSVWQTSSIQNRLGRNREKKERIAQFAATLIKNDESIFIDGGSTNQILAPMIKDLRNMLFVTNSPDIADILIENEENRIIQIGGELTRDTHLTIGPDAEDNIRKYYVDKCITSVSGVDPDVGCYAAIPMEASMKRTLVSQARETILLVDSSKFSRKAFCLAFDMSKVMAVVTDSDTPKDEIEKLRSKDIAVYVV
jgi:DeoR/GlpR family transcriptional regulator of sugar metabolism